MSTLSISAPASAHQPEILDLLPEGHDALAAQIEDYRKLATVRVRRSASIPHALAEIEAAESAFELTRKQAEALAKDVVKNGLLSEAYKTAVAEAVETARSAATISAAVKRLAEAADAKTIATADRDKAIQTITRDGVKRPASQSSARSGARFPKWFSGIGSAAAGLFSQPTQTLKNLSTRGKASVAAGVLLIGGGLTYALIAGISGSDTRYSGPGAWGGATTLQAGDTVVTIEDVTFRGYALPMGARGVIAPGGCPSGWVAFQPVGSPPGASPECLPSASFAKR